MFRALFYPMDVKFYTINVHASVTNSMSVCSYPGMCIGKYVVFSVQCKVCSVQYAICSVQCGLLCVQHLMFNVQSAVCIVYYAV